MARNPWSDDPEPTAQPTERPIGEADDENVVPPANVGGAAPTSGGDSGGNLPGPEDDLGTLYADEPAAAPEISAMSIREADEENP